VPSLTADRAESVLHDIQMARAGATTAAAGPAQLAGAEAGSAVAEREANMLLAKGEQSKAQAKFNEAESLRTTEAGGVAVGRAATAPAVDSSIQKISAGEPAAPPTLSAPDAPAQSGTTAPTTAGLELAPTTEPKTDAPVAIEPASNSSTP